MITIFLLISSAGMNTLLMPASAKGVLTYYSSSAGDEAIFYNPAMFYTQKDFHLSAFYSSIYLSMRNLNLALSKKLNNIDFGISLMNFDYGPIMAKPDYPTSDSSGFYTATDFYVGLCASKIITTNGRLGMKLKYLYENLYIYSGATVAFDLSLAYIAQNYGISTGATNIGGTMRIASESVNLPAKLSIGYYRKIEKVTLSLDLHYLINTGRFESAVAGEMRLTDNFDLGIAMNYRDSFYPGFYLGLKHRSTYIRYGTSIYPYNLGMIHTIGIGFGF
ncbi:MAG: hypothetical protein ACUVQ4_03050 [bacterium]